MPVAVHMVEPQPGGRERLELRLDLGRHFATGEGIEEHFRPGRRHVGMESAVRPDQPACLPGRQNRASFNQIQVQPHPKSRHSTGPLRGVGRRWTADHQAGRREHTLTMGNFHGLVHGQGGAEIVGGDDQSSRVHG